MSQFLYDNLLHSQKRFFCREGIAVLEVLKKSDMFLLRRSLIWMQKLEHNSTETLHCLILWKKMYNLKIWRQISCSISSVSAEKEPIQMLMSLKSLTCCFASSPDKELKSGCKNENTLQQKHWSYKFNKQVLNLNMKMKKKLNLWLCK